MPYVIESILVVNMLYIIRDRAEVPIPKAVLYKASEIPTASAARVTATAFLAQGGK